MLINFYNLIYFSVQDHRCKSRDRIVQMRPYRRRCSRTDPLPSKPFSAGDSKLCPLLPLLCRSRKQSRPRIQWSREETLMCQRHHKWMLLLLSTLDILKCLPSYRSHWISSESCSTPFKVTTPSTPHCIDSCWNKDAQFTVKPCPSGTSAHLSDWNHFKLV